MSGWSPSWAEGDGERHVVPGVVVAGIPVRHDLPARWDLGPDPYPGWTDGRVAAEPLTLVHALGDGQGLRVVIDSPDTQETYLVDDAGELAVRFGGRRPGERDQWLRTVRPGAEYALLYSDASECPTRQWRWQRTALMYAFAARGTGVMAHAAAFTLPSGLGVLVPGASGVGKSTLASQIAAELGVSAVLSDDRVAVSAEGAGMRIWGTPWYSSGRYLGSGDAVLRAVVLPERSAGAPPVVRDITAAAALPRLLRAVAAPFWSEALMASMLETFDVLLRNVPVVEYSYTPGSGAMRPLLRAIG